MYAPCTYANLCKKFEKVQMGIQLETSASETISNLKPFIIWQVLAYTMYDIYLKFVTCLV
uniref:Uncharacterized protein n=1 Tax=Arundo donax TaxID=35708 RepID=A0A0A9EJJ2_ARUDO